MSGRHTALLPDDFDILVSEAIAEFWGARSLGSGSQGGTRGNVIAGKNLDGFIRILERVVEHCGLPVSSVKSGRGKAVTLPGYFRPTKAWDLLVVADDRLLAVMELKSHVGSFGNNFNNRSEEALGNAVDLQHSALQNNFQRDRVDIESGDEARLPFVGYLMILEECEGSCRAINLPPSQFEAMAIFEGTSYAERYRILCERMMKEKLYDSAALALTEQSTRGERGEYRTLSKATSIRHLFAKLAGHLSAEVETMDD
jgi:hypothetical protein